jgi:two-component system cell cycle sensor histidine kinase/response regulator CckA
MTEQRFDVELILAAITDGILVVDQQGIVLYANQSAEHIFERGSLLASDLGIPLSPTDSYQDINLIRPSGIGWAELRSSSITWKGKAAYVIGVRDITERKQMENALRDSQARLTTAQHIAHLGNWERNPINNQLWWSAEIYHIVEIDPLSFDGTYEAFLGIIHPEDREAVNIAYTKHLEDRQPYGNTYRLLMPDSRIKYLHEECETVFDLNGTAICSTGTVQDITDITQQQEEALVMHMQHDQASKMESIGHLTAGIAHDFNNILAAIMGYTELSQYMLAAGKPEVVVPYQEKILSAGTRAKELIAQMLAFSRTSQCKQGELPPVTLLKPVVKEVVALLRSTIPSTMHLNCRIEDKTLQACIQPVHLHQIILNLGVNARDAIGEYGNIDIALSRYHGDNQLCSACKNQFSGDFAQITVKDSGSGIPKSVMDKIFEPFFTTKSVGEGTGMGLSVVHGLVLASEGHILVESSTTNGTSFNILLPLEISTPLLQETVGVVDVDNVNGVRIMVVDDELSIAMMLNEYLTAYGAHVVSFTNPINALEAFVHNADNIDLVITDEAMPGISGMLLAEKMRLLQPDLPIILCTGYSEHANPESAANVGIAGFFAKPINMNELLQKIRTLCACKINDSVRAIES